jgi:hypothetical protein
MSHDTEATSSKRKYDSAIDTYVAKSITTCKKNPIHCGKPYFSNNRQNGEWTEKSTRQNEIELAMFG